MIAPITLLFGLLSLASASPINKRDVPISKCTTIMRGKLGVHGDANIGLSADNTLTFGASPLEVEFQSCQPNFGHFDGKVFPTGGHIVVQSTGKCVTLKPGSTEPPFLFTVADCYGNDDSGQEASNFVQEQDGPIYFVGTTQADGSQNWHSDICHSGYFGAFDAKTSGPVGFGCYDNESAETAGLLLAKWTFVSPPPPRRMIG